MKRILFIHGLNVSKEVWKPWVEKFEEKGFSCTSISYPYHDGAPAELRKNPDKRLRKLRMKDLVHTYARFIQSLPEKPILIGHSMGGLVVQKLIEKNLGAAGICLASAPAMGVFSFKISFLINNTTMINLFKGNTLFTPSPAWMHQAIANTVSREELNHFYEKFVVPESRNIPRSILLDGTIDFKKPHAPLLFVGAEFDRITLCKINRRNAAAYTHKKSITEFREFKGRSHILCWEKGWEDVLDCCEAFINRTVPAVKAEMGTETKVGGKTV